MRRGTIVWMAMLGLCIAATVYETPNITRICHGALDSFRERRTVSERVVALDPEAGEILRYAMKYRHGDPIRQDLRNLIARYPENEVFLSQLATALTKVEQIDVQAVLAMTDKLIALSPENAHYRYLRGWILWKTLGSNQIREAMAEFARGHQRPEFYLPYVKYKGRVDRLTQELVLRMSERIRIHPFYTSMENSVSQMAGSKDGVDRDLLSDVTVSVRRIADRAIDGAHDFCSLDAGAGLLESVEAVRLRELQLSAAEARESRWRLARAIGLAQLEREWSHREFDLTAERPGIPMAVGFLVTILVTPFVGDAVLRRRRREKKGQRLIKLTDLMTAGLLGLGTSILLLVHRSGIPGIFMDVVFGLSWALWWGHAYMLIRVRPRALTRHRYSELWATTAYGLLWLNGVFLVAGVDGSAAPGHSTVGSLSSPVTGGWSVFSVLLWILAANRERVFGRISHVRARVLVMSWAAALMFIHAVGLQWQLADRIFADSLAPCRPLPAATHETYQRFIVFSAPCRYERDDPRALPEYIEYATPEDMEAFLARRRAEGKPLSKYQLYGLLERCGRDTRPVIQKALEEPHASPSR